MPSNQANVGRLGTNVTVETLPLSVHHALAIAEKLEPEGISAEVLDLRSMVPLNRAAVMESVERTGRLVVADDYLSYRLSGEASATITDEDPALLKAPVQRVTMPESPIPSTHDLEHVVLPPHNQIEGDVRQVLA